MELTKKRREIDMTTGALLPKIILFVLPLIASNLLQTLYSAADMMVVSLSDEVNAVGAIGFTGHFINIIINFFIGFGAGATVVVARHIGAKDEQGVSKAVHTAISMSAVFGLFAAGLGVLVSEWVLTLMGAQGNILHLATTYTRIYFCGAPFIALTNYCTSILRAKGDTKTPLIVLSVSGIINVLLNLFFVLVVGLSVEGVALATLAANAISGFVLLFLLTKDTGACRVTLKKLRVDRDSFLEILYIGLPAGLQSVVFSISNMMIQSSIMRVNNSFGYDQSGYQPVMDGHAAATNLEGFIYTAQNAVAQAAIAFTSQHVGAESYQRIKRVMLNCYLVCFFISLSLSGFMLLLRDPLLALYGVRGGAEGSAEALALETAYTKLTIMFPTYFILGFLDEGAGFVRGLGRSTTSMIVSLTGACLVRILWVVTVFDFVFKKGDAMRALSVLYLSYPVTWVLTAAVQFICAWVILRKMIKRQKAKKEAPKA